MRATRRRTRRSSGVVHCRSMFANTSAIWYLTGPSMCPKRGFPQSRPSCHAGSAAMRLSRSVSSTKGRFIVICLRFFSPQTLHKFTGYLHEERVIDGFIAAYKLYHTTAPSAFEAIDARHSLVLGSSRGDAPEIVGVRAPLFRPAHGLPLQEIVGHQLALLVARRAIQVDSLVCKQANEDAGQQLSVVLGQKEAGLVARRKDIPGIQVIIGGMDAKLVARASRLQQAIPGGHICGRLRGAERHSLASCETHVVAPFLLHLGQQCFFSRRQVH